MKKGEWWIVTVLAVILALLMLSLVGCKSLPVVQEEGPVTAEWILAVLAAMLSLALEVVPGLAGKWNGLDATVKRLIWLGGCLGVPLVILAAGCAGLDLGVLAPACSVEGVIESLRIGFAAFFASQVTYAAVARGIRKRKASIGPLAYK